MRFIVIVAMYNMANHIPANIRALKEQTHSDFRCLIGDDISTDDSAAVVEELIQDDARFELVRHTEKKFSMGNIHTLIEHARPAPEDVLVLVDGDDRLAHPGVLEKLRDIYETEKCWMTYGSYSGGGEVPDRICRPYSSLVVKLNLFRHFKWRASHLKTFKYKLWAQLRPSDFTVTEKELRRARRRALLTGRLKSWYYWRQIEHKNLVNPSGKFARRCSDKTMTLPMLEIAGKKSLFIDEILYHYWVDPDKKLDYDRKTVPQKWYTRCIRDILMHKSRYLPVDELPAKGFAWDDPDDEDELLNENI